MEKSKTEQLVTEDELKEWTKYVRTGDIIRFLRENQVPFWEGRGGRVLTTLEAINSSLLNKQITHVEDDVW
ncbi:MAG: hypothetical protein B0D91_14080 [Oceanospirillales bacterium LUC14_002_19_P2]|nr:MAG: hypothetical protein B0D91_14080 [Oceanospirillales bacterium LUC14_002_19_P2]